MRLFRRRAVGYVIACGVCAAVVLGAWRHVNGDAEAPCSVSAGTPTGRMRMEILVDSGEFMTRLEQDLRQAQARVAVQTMSFEGDSAGDQLAAALTSCPAPTRLLLVDSYSRFVVSDKFRFFPKYWRDTELRHEIRRMRTTLAVLQASGVDVKLTNPLDPLLIRFMARNHKKMILIDGRVAYIGGVNFCDHNFAWHDMMIRFESEEVTEFLWEDFLATWRGVNRCAQRDFAGVWLASLDGRRNASILTPVIRAINGARRRIVVESGYITFPFFRWLRAARARGVEVVLLTPEMNNKPIVSHYLLWEATRARLEIRLYPGRMSHLKAMLIDDATLVAGSSNFDYISHATQQEIVAMVRDPAAIEEFRRRVLAPDLVRSKPYTGRVWALGGWPRFVAMKVIGNAMTGMIRVLDGLMGQPGPESVSEWAG